MLDNGAGAADRRQQATERDLAVVDGRVADVERAVVQQQQRAAFHRDGVGDLHRLIPIQLQARPERSARADGEIGIGKTERAAFELKETAVVGEHAGGEAVAVQSEDAERLNGCGTAGRQVM